MNLWSRVSPDWRTSAGAAAWLAQPENVRNLVRSAPRSARNAIETVAWDGPYVDGVTAYYGLPKGHPLAALKVVAARALHELRLISFSTTLPIGAALESAFAVNSCSRFTKFGIAAFSAGLKKLANNTDSV